MDNMVSSALGLEPMAKPKRNDVPVKIDAEVVRKGRIVAAFRDITLAEYFSELLGPLVAEHLLEHMRDGAEPTADDSPKRRPPTPS
jgi:hypothetical protein